MKKTEKVIIYKKDRGGLFYFYHQGKLIATYTQSMTEFKDFIEGIYGVWYDIKYIEYSNYKEVKL